MPDFLDRERQEQRERLQHGAEPLRAAETAPKDDAVERAVAEALETEFHRRYGPLNTPDEDATFDALARAALAAAVPEKDESDD